MKREAKKKVGIMGGTFDPIHMGHLILAERAYDKFNLDKVLIMPTGNPPHKANQANTGAKQRAKMSKLAIKDNHYFELSLLEIRRKGYTYTYETLEALKRKNKDTEYYFIMGVDSLFSLDKWREPERICKNCIIVVAARNHVATSELKDRIKYLEDRYDATIYCLDTPTIDIASHNIRSMVGKKKSIRYFVPREVEKYIYKHGLYQYD